MWYTTYLIVPYLLIGLGYAVNTFCSFKPAEFTFNNVLASAFGLLLWPLGVYLKVTDKSISGIN